MTSVPMAPGSAAVQEYSIRVPKTVKKKYQVMRFNSSVNVDFGKWSQVKMERENNMKEFKGLDEDIPKQQILTPTTDKFVAFGSKLVSKWEFVSAIRFGAGSEFGRDAREEARRKKYGIISKKYRPQDQPWILKVGGKTGKKFRGIREGGVAENAAYYVFTHSPDGGIDAFPLTEWYNFQPIQRYKALTAEEAEEEFGRRNKSFNLFSVMMRKRLHGGEDVEGDEPEEGKGKKSFSKKKELKISDMDDWVDSGDDTDSESGSDKEKEKEEKEEKKNKKDKNKKATKAKKKKKDSDDEAFEESDDGDEEGRELDYISDSSESDSDHEGKANKQLKGVAEEDALRKLLSSGEEDDDEEKKEEGDKESEGEDKEKNKQEGDKLAEKDKKGGTSGAKKKTKSKKLTKKVKKEDSNTTKESTSEFSSDSSESENELKKKAKEGVKLGKESNSATSSRSGSPTKDVAADSKRKATSAPEVNPSKKARLDNFASATLAPYSWDSGITEDAVRRYLMRKPMTTTELLQKFKSKKTGLTSDQLVNIMTQILKRINPVKQMIKGKMYLSIKA
uniref:Transcription initiation factor IIF subunit alpha n=2 Tax=Timema TaxID=61471 RepID=A0A7R9CGA9_TIMCR|nr:unnamed protein product [Timema cristinae]